MKKVTLFYLIFLSSISIFSFPKINTDEVENLTFIKDTIVLEVFIEDKEIYMEYNEPFPEIIDISKLFIKTIAYNNSSITSPKLMIEFYLNSPRGGGIKPIIIPPTEPGAEQVGEHVPNIDKSDLDANFEYKLKTELSDITNDIEIQTLTNFFVVPGLSELSIPKMQLSSNRYNKVVDIELIITNTGKDIENPLVDSGGIAGDSDIIAFYTTSYFSFDPKLDKNDTKIFSQKTSRLLQNQNEFQSHRINLSALKLPDNFNFLDGYIIVTVDSSNTIDEVSESNNTVILPTSTIRSPVSKSKKDTIRVLTSPNPFTESITFSFEKELSISRGELFIYNATGILVDRKIISTDLTVGKQSFYYTNSLLRKGIYSYTLQTRTENYKGIIVKN